MLKIRIRIFSNIYIRIFSYCLLFEINPDSVSVIDDLTFQSNIFFYSYSAEKPKSLEEYSNWSYKSAQMGAIFGYRNFTWTASDGGITRAKRTQNKPLGVQYEMQ